MSIKKYNFSLEELNELLSKPEDLEEDALFFQNLLEDKKNIFMLAEPQRGDALDSVFKIYLNKFKKIMTAEVLTLAIPFMEQGEPLNSLSSLIRRKQENSIIELITEQSEKAPDFGIGFFTSMYIKNIDLDFVSENHINAFIQNLERWTGTSPDFVREFLVKLDSKNLKNLLVSEKLTDFILTSNIYNQRDILAKVFFAANKHYPEAIYKQSWERVQINKLIQMSTACSLSVSSEVKGLIEKELDDSHQWVKKDTQLDDVKVKMIENLGAYGISKISCLWLYIIKKNEPQTFEKIKDLAMPCINSLLRINFENSYDDNYKMLVWLSNISYIGDNSLSRKLLSGFKEYINADVEIKEKNLFINRKVRLSDLILENFNNAINASVQDESDKLKPIYLNTPGYEFMKKIGYIMPLIIESEKDEVKKSLLKLVFFINSQPFKNGEIKRVDIIESCLPEHIELLKDVLRSLANLKNNEDKDEKESPLMKIRNALIYLAVNKDDLADMFIHKDILLEEKILETQLNKKGIGKNNQAAPKVVKF